MPTLDPKRDPKDEYVRELQRELMDTRGRILRLELTLGTLIHWLVQSANSPLRPDEAHRLLDLLQQEPSAVSN